VSGSAKAGPAPRGNALEPPRAARAMSMSANSLARANPDSVNTMRDWEQVRDQLLGTSHARAGVCSGRNHRLHAPVSLTRVCVDRVDRRQRNTIDQIKLSLFQLTDFLNTFEVRLSPTVGAPASLGNL
jgi:hypothetical protein